MRCAGLYRFILGLALTAGSEAWGGNMWELVTDLNFTQWVLTLGLGASTFCYLLGMFSAEEFFAADSEEPSEPEDQLGISVLKPLRGLDIGLYDNLASLCRQRYGRYQIICGVADESDPAGTLVRKLQREYPDVDLELVVDDRVYGSNYKVSNLINMYERAKHELIVIADSDIRVGPTYLASLDTAVRPANVGLATCLYRAVNRGGIPTLIESLFINTDFMALVMLARKVEKSSYAFGATIAIRRSILDEIGGFSPIVNSLADDYQIGFRVSQKGYDLIVTNVVVDTILALGNWRRLFDHQLRWARTYRICRPAGYFGSILTHGTLWSTLNVLYHAFSPLSCLISGAALAVRYASAISLSWRHLRTKTSWTAMLMVPIKDLLFDALWLMAFAGDTVVWGGHRFRVDRNGQMIDLDGEPVLSVLPSAQSAAGSEVQKTADQRS